jgi:hypothetical protein
MTMVGPKDAPNSALETLGGSLFARFRIVPEQDHLPAAGGLLVVFFLTTGIRHRVALCVSNDAQFEGSVLVYLNYWIGAMGKIDDDAVKAVTRRPES